MHPTPTSGSDPSADASTRTRERGAAWVIRRRARAASAHTAMTSASLTVRTFPKEVSNSSVGESSSNPDNVPVRSTTITRSKARRA